LKLHIFVPIFFDTESFLTLQEKILALYPEANVHVFDDSAGLDPAVKELKSVKVQVMPENLGHQRAIVQGLRDFLRSQKEECLIITMDGDGQDRPEDIPALLQAFEQGDRPLVLARRTSRPETPIFKFCYFFYKILFRLLTGTLIRSGNFALYDSKRAHEILFHPYFNSCYASSLVSLASPIRFVPCARGARYMGESKMSFSRLALHGLRMLSPFRWRIFFRFCGLGMLGALLLLWFLLQPVKVLAIGESTTFLGGEGAWPRLLEKKLRAECGSRMHVSTFAVPGSDTYDMAARIPAALSIYKPSLVIAMLGINDYENTTREIDVETLSFFERGFRSEKELSEAVFEHVLDKDPWRDRRYAFLFSRHYRDHQLFEEGVRRNQQILDKRPGHPWALAELGAHLRYSNDGGRAEALHRQAVAAEPRNLAFRLELLSDLMSRDAEFEAALREARAALGDDRPLDFFAAGRLQGKGDWAGHLREMRKITGEGCRTRKCLLMLKLSLEKNGLRQEAGAVALPEQEPMLPVTVRNFERVIREVKQSASLFLMQYPLRRAAELAQFGGVEGVISNEENFRNAGPFEELFTDRFAGDFGHFTPKSSELVAENAAKALLPWLRKRFLCGISL